MSIKIAPSILAADLTRLGEEVRAVVEAGADYIHVDVMDGQFVPNISFGQPVVEALRGITDTVLDVHLMIDRPERYVESFAAAGADIITVHVEACVHLHRVLQAIRATGKRAGVTLNPATPLDTLRWVLDDVDLVLLMSVNPGFGGQRFIPSTLGRLGEMRRMLEAAGADAELEVDGGVSADNTRAVVEAGADVLVSGTGIFGQPSYGETIERMRSEARAAEQGVIEV